MAVATKTRKRGPVKKSDAYEVITDRIVAALEGGVVPWHQPWDARTQAPRSLSSGKLYRGINTFVLLWTSMSNGYSSPWWGTYRQITERGGQVRAGEKGTPVVFWRILEFDDPTAKDGKRKVPMLRHFTVFNAEQADGDEFRVPAGEPVVDADYVDPVERADAIVSAYLTDGPTLKHGGDRAFYRPSTDHVQVPLTEQFHSTGGYYSTLFHELGHSTGAAARLNRDGITAVDSTFGSDPYGREELIAEMTAAFLCGESGVEIAPETHAGYVGAWLQTIQADPKILVQAAGSAQKAANLILGETTPASGQEDES